MNIIKELIMNYLKAVIKQHFSNTLLLCDKILNLGQIWDLTPSQNFWLKTAEPVATKH